MKLRTPGWSLGCTLVLLQLGTVQASQNVTHVAHLATTPTAGHPSSDQVLLIEESPRPHQEVRSGWLSQVGTSLALNTKHEALDHGKDHLKFEGQTAAEAANRLQWTHDPLIVSHLRVLSDQIAEVRASPDVVSGLEDDSVGNTTITVIFNDNSYALLMLSLPSSFKEDVIRNTSNKPGNAVQQEFVLYQEDRQIPSRVKSSHFGRTLKTKDLFRVLGKHRIQVKSTSPASHDGHPKPVTVFRSAD